MLKSKKNKSKSTPEKPTRKEIRRRLKEDKNPFLLFWEAFAEQEPTLEQFQLLLDSGAGLNQVNSGQGGMKGWTPLMLAAWHKSAEITAFFLEKGADVAHIAPDQESALTLAIYQNHEKIVKLLEAAGAVTTRAKLLRARLLGAAVRNEWQYVLEHGPETLELNPEEWTVSYNFALALEKAGQYPEARALADRAVYEKAQENYFLDVSLRSALKAGDYVSAQSYWEKHKLGFNPGRIPADNFLANLLIVYINQVGPQAAVAEVEPFLERALSCSQKGLLEFNLSCTYALAGEIKQTVQYGLASVSKGKPVGDFEKESDFDELRNHPYFAQFLKAAKNDFQQCLYLAHPEGASVETELRMEDNYINWWLKKSPYAPARHQTKKFSTNLKTLEAYNQLLLNFKSAGFKEGAPACIEAWAEALPEMLNKLREQTSANIGALVLEWKPETIESDHLLVEYSLHGLEASTSEEIEESFQSNLIQSLAQVDFISHRILGRETFQEIIARVAGSLAWNSLSVKEEILIGQFQAGAGLDFWITPQALGLVGKTQ